MTHLDELSQPVHQYFRICSLPLQLCATQLDDFLIFARCVFLAISWDMSWKFPKNLTNTTLPNCLPSPRFQYVLEYFRLSLIQILDSKVTSPGLIEVILCETRNSRNRVAPGQLVPCGWRRGLHHSGKSCAFSFHLAEKRLLFQGSFFHYQPKQCTIKGEMIQNYHIIFVVVHSPPNG